MYVQQKMLIYRLPAKGLHLSLIYFVGPIGSFLRALKMVVSHFTVRLKSAVI